MKNIWLITISTLQRTWIISLGPYARTIMSIFALAFMAVTTIGAFVIYEFSNTTSELTKQKQQLDAQIVMLHSKMRGMQNEIDSQRYTFAKLDELEALSEVPFLPPEQHNVNYALPEKSSQGVGIIQKHKHMLERIEKIKLSLVERNWLFQNIPNGNPLATSRRVTSSFGRRNHPVTGKNQFHYGIDLAAKRNENVLAVADGVVEFAGENRSGFGIMVIILHNYGFETTYAHLDEYLVTKGDFVRRGQFIGKAGDTGVTTGVHLHYEVKYLGKRINPYPFVRWNAENYGKLFTQEEPIQWPTLINMVRLQVQHHNQLQ